MNFHIKKVIFLRAVFALLLGISALSGPVAYGAEPPAPAVAALVDGIPEAGRQVEQSEGGNGLRYWLYLPVNHAKSKPSPVLIFLHGVGERGTELKNVLRHGPPMLLARDKSDELRVLKENFIVISPQCRPNSFWFDNVKDLFSVLDVVTKNFAGDTNRTYLTGLSMGGYGTWRIAGHYSDRFAAIAPICGGKAPAYGGGSLEEIAQLRQDLPIWAQHGDADKVVPYKDSFEIVERLEKAGGAPFLRLTAPTAPEVMNERVFTTHIGGGHDIWRAAYDDTRLYEWLLHWSKKTAN